MGMVIHRLWLRERLHTLAALHICYTLEAQHSFARVCYIHSLSPSLHQILTRLRWPLVSLSPFTTGEGGVCIPSHREGEEVQH